MQLPRPLEPWRAWLNLFSPDLIEPLGDLLMQLHPIVGRLQTSPLQDNQNLAGIGNIAQRGTYERLLMTEWAYADAEPDEFIRRAAGGELLFMAPEPDTRMCSKRCISLFDAGPSQLGEPRIAHIAFFILLARRAEEAGALYQWGILQEPGKLHTDTSLRGLQIFLNARTLNSPSQAHLNSWGEVLNPNDNEQIDIWQLAAGLDAASKRVSTLVSIRRELITQSLKVCVQQKRTKRELSLELPDDKTSIRLLRDPFTPLATLGRLKDYQGNPSLKQPPLFSTCGKWLAVPQLDGGAVLFNVPNSPKSKPGKVRRQENLNSKGNTLAVGVFKKSIGTVLSRDGTLVFSGFPGEKFSRLNPECARPDIASFRAPVGLARWLPAFFLNTQEHNSFAERVIVLDIDKKLVCWEYVPTRNSIHPSRLHLSCREIACDVMSAVQVGKQLVFGKISEGKTQLYSWDGRGEMPVPLEKKFHSSRRLFFGLVRTWTNNQHGLVALQKNDTEWSLEDRQVGVSIHLFDNPKVAGVTSRYHEGQLQNGLIVLLSDQKTIQFRTHSSQYTLFKSHAAIAQISVDPCTGHIAWLTVTHEIIVRDINHESPLLHVISKGAEHVA